MPDKSTEGFESLRDAASNKIMFFGRELLGLWLDPSLLHTLAPLRDEIGTELFQLLVAHSSSQGTKEDYEAMVSVLADNFQDGFLAWGRAVGGVGWGRFEIHEFDEDKGTASVVVRSPWELVMQERLDDPWGCPFLRGKLIGIFRYALGGNCWADERSYVENGEPVVELSLYQSSMTIAAELDRLRRRFATEKAAKLHDEVARQTELVRRSEERLRATLSSLDGWVLTLTVDGRIAAQHRPEGVPFPVAEVGQRLEEALPASAADVVSSACQAALAGGGPRAVDVDMPGGTFAHASVTPVHGLDGETDALTVVIRDLTERRNAEQTRARLEAQLHQSQKMEALGQLTGGVAHDFNNLLTVIAGNLELIKRQQSPDARQQSIEDSMAAVRSAATLTQQLLAFSRKQPLQPRRLAPLVLLHEMETLLARTLGERFKLSIAGPTDQWDCEVDPDQLRSAVVNLVINARDAMPEGGPITIETGNEEIGVRHGSAHHDLSPGMYVRVAVSDRGVGVAQENLDKVFEPFFTTKGLGKGTGLGLSMVYGFARQSQGAVRITSEPGRGTTLALYLPRATASSLEPVRPSAPRETDGTAHRRVVLVVEDDDAVRRLVVRFLDQLGYQPIEFADARAALEVLRSSARVDVLLTDVVLAGDLDGPSLANHARRQRPELSVLYMSGYTQDAQLQLESGEAVELLVKPFSNADLAERLERLLTSA